MAETSPAPAPDVLGGEARMGEGEEDVPGVDAAARAVAPERFTLAREAAGEAPPLPSGPNSRAAPLARGSLTSAACALDLAVASGCMGAELASAVPLAGRLAVGLTDLLRAIRRA